MNSNEKSLILFFETCAVDRAGAVDARRMNTGDHEVAGILAKDGVIEPLERVASEDLTETRTFKVTMTEKGWKLAAEFRRERADRMNDRRQWKTIREKREGKE